jgi:heme exporter protein D
VNDNAIVWGAFGLAGLAIGGVVLLKLSGQRAQLLREERARLDAAAKAKAGDPVLNTLSDVFDPIHLFH